MKKRSNGEGSYSKLPSGNWRAQIMVGYTSEGKKVVKSFTAPTKAEAQQMVHDYLSKSKDSQKHTSIQFSEWADAWYADYITQVEESTYWNYGYTLKKLKEYFGSKPLCEIKPIDINRFIDSLLEQNYSKSVIGKCKSMLVQIFASAEDNDMIPKNPAIRAKKAKVKKTSNDIGALKGEDKKHAYTDAQIAILKKELPDTLLGNSILSLIGSGMRVQELLALTKDDIAPDGSVISVNKAVKIAQRQPYLGTTKSEKGNRQIPISREYRKYVQYLRDHGGEPFIWTSSRENKLFSIEEFRNRYRCVMKKVEGVPFYTPHCCRHTYITNLQAKHVSMDIIRELAGHEDMNTTLGYTHTSFDTLKSVIDGLDKVFDSSDNKKAV